MDLVIVESPTKAKTLAKFLGSGYQIEASYGHVRDLPQKKLGIEIKRLSDRAKKIYLATDPDREGEAIAWHVAMLIQKSKVKSQKLNRIVFHEITKTAIDKPLGNPREIDMQLVVAR